MTIYRRRASSSPLALRRSLQRRLALCEKVAPQQSFAAWLTPEDEEADTRDLADADIDEHIDPAAVEGQRVARSAALQRVEQMEATVRSEEEANISRQHEAARSRLMRELARTLRCIGPGDLNALLRKQVQSEALSDGRYHRALKLLGGVPRWRQEDLADADAFVKGLSPNERQGRVTLGSEVDAALNDPRWRAVHKQ